MSLCLSFPLCSSLCKSALLVSGPGGHAGDIAPVCVEVREKSSAHPVPTRQLLNGVPSWAPINALAPGCCLEPPVWVSELLCVAVLEAFLAQPPSPRHTLCVLCRDEK